MTITNHAGAPLALAVWAVHDDYDYINEKNYVSATALMKPVKQSILASRVPPELQENDVQDYISRALGNSIHAGLEKAWLDGYKRSLELLGYREHVISSVRVNPDKEEPGTIPVYVEQREFREINGYKIGGKYDLVLEGILHDLKTTSAYAWKMGTRDDEYALQGSIYRWLAPHKITSDFIRVCFVFTDWQKAVAASDPTYPQSRVEYKDVPLLSMEDTEAFIVNRLNEYRRARDLPEKNMIPCTDDELWLSETVYKYYADPTKTSGRSTKNFTSLSEANSFKASKGRGVVITFEGKPKRCDYCSAAPICEQRKRYFND